MNSLFFLPLQEKRERERESTERYENKEQFSNITSFCCHFSVYGFLVLAMKLLKVRTRNGKMLSVIFVILLR